MCSALLILCILIKRKRIDYMDYSSKASIIRASGILVPKTSLAFKSNMAAFPPSWIFWTKLVACASVREDTKIQSALLRVRELSRRLYLSFNSTVWDWFARLG